MNKWTTIWYTYYSLCDLFRLQLFHLYMIFCNKYLRKAYFCSQERKCDFWEWIDYPFPSQAKATIFEQYIKAQELEHKAAKLELELKEARGAVATTNEVENSAITRMAADISALHSGLSSIRRYVKCTWTVIWIMFIVLVVSELWETCI